MLRTPSSLHCFGFYQPPYGPDVKSMTASAGTESRMLSLVVGAPPSLHRFSDLTFDEGRGVAEKLYGLAEVRRGMGGAVDDPANAVCRAHARGHCPFYHRASYSPADLL